LKIFLSLYYKKVYLFNGLSFTYNIQQNIEDSFFFYEIFIKNRKALQQKAKGLELASSPYWTLSELLKEILQLKMLD